MTRGAPSRRHGAGLALQLGGLMLVNLALLIGILRLNAGAHERRMTADFESKAEAVALAISFGLSQGDVTRETPSMRSFLTIARSIEGLAYIYVQDDEASIVAHTFSPFPAEFVESNWVAPDELVGRSVKVAPLVEIQLAKGRLRAIDVAAPIAGGKGVVHVGVDRRVIEEEVGNFRRRTLLAIGVACLTAAALALGLLLRIVRPLRRLTRVAEAITERNDLEQVIDVHSSDEVGRLADALRKMVDHLATTRRTVVSSVEDLGGVIGTLDRVGRSVADGTEVVRGRVEEATTQVSRSLETLRMVADGAAALRKDAAAGGARIDEMVGTNERLGEGVRAVASAVDQTRGSIERMVAGVYRIAQSLASLDHSLSDTASSVREMDASTSEVERKAQRTLDLSRQVADAARSGGAALTRTLDGIQNIRRSSDQATEAISSLGALIAQVGSIVDFITEISDRTNLLALNAAIIASQSGEQGKGFKVVADEIKELAARTRSSAQEVTQRIVAIQEHSRQATAVMRTGADHVIDGVELGNEAARAMERIVATAAECVAMVVAIAELTSSHAGASRRIDDSVQQIRAAAADISRTGGEQVGDGKQILEANQQMLALVELVTTATAEHSKSSTDVTLDIERIGHVASQLHSAQLEQREGAALVLARMRAIRTISDTLARSVAELDAALRSLQQQSTRLDEEAQRFA